jgi:hypothetical protein
MTTTEYNYKGFQVVITDARRVVVSSLRSDLVQGVVDIPDFSALDQALRWIDSRLAEVSEVGAVGTATSGRSWTVSYTAKRKRLTYEQQTVTVTVTDEQYRKFMFGGDPAEANQADIEQLAVEHGKPHPLGWSCYSDDVESLDEADFEIVEG